jgi:Ser/Thr protein kinase RdoA (MazF antagonist)
MPQPYRKKTDRDESLLAEILSNYDIGELNDAIYYEAWGDRLLVQLKASRGRYILKQWLQHISAGQRAAILGLQATARQNGFPIPDCVANRSGALSTAADGSDFSVYAYVGHSYNPNLADGQILSVATTAGKLHAVLTNPDVPCPTWREGSFPWARGFIEHAREQVHESVASTVAPILDRVEDLLTDAVDRLDRLGWADLPAVPIHGDFCQFNCRFTGANVSGVIDWDCARKEPRIVEVAFAMNIGLGWSREIDYYENFQWSLSRNPQVDEMIEWLKAYLSEGPRLSEQELRMLPYACAAIWPSPGAGFVPDSEQNLRRCGRFESRMASLISDATAISDALYRELDTRGLICM